MSKTSLSRPDKILRYQPSIRGQLSTISPIAFMFFATVFYASMLRNQAIAHWLYILSLIYPFVVLVDLLQTLPRLNYLELRPDGIHIKAMGFITKFVSWSSIESVDVSRVGGMVAVIGIKSYHSHKKSWRQMLRKRLFGSEDFISPAYLAPDHNLAYELRERLKKYQAEKS